RGLPGWRRSWGRRASAGWPIALGARLTRVPTMRTAVSLSELEWNTGRVVCGLGHPPGTLVSRISPPRLVVRLGERAGAGHVGVSLGRLASYWRVTTALYGLVEAARLTTVLQDVWLVTASRQRGDVSWGRQRKGSSPCQARAVVAANSVTAWSAACSPAARMAGARQRTRCCG